MHKEYLSLKYADKKSRLDNKLKSIDNGTKSVKKQNLFLSNTRFIFNAREKSSA